MKKIRISFEGFEDNTEKNYILVGDLFGDKKMLKEKINDIIEDVFRK